MDKLPSEEHKNVDCLLKDALSDGVINESQYNELLSRSKVKAKINEKKDIQRSLIGSGIAIIVFVVGVLFLWMFREFGYVAKVSIMILLTITLFIGSLMAMNREKWKLHFGLLAGASHLFVFGYGYWFLNEASNSGYRNYTASVDRNPFLAIPLIIIPTLVMLYLIHKNSRGGSHLGLFSLVFGNMILFTRLIDDIISGETLYYLYGVVGAIIFIFIVYVNLQWLQGKLPERHSYYKQRYRTIDSLSSSGYVFGSIYLFFYFGVAFDLNNDSWVYVGTIIILMLAFAMIFYGIKFLKKGLFASACGVVLASTWILGLATMHEVGFLVMGVLTGFMLIGISLLIKDVPEFKKGYKDLPPAPPYSHLLEDSPASQDQPMDNPPERE
ncbi:MAG: DUF2157 domain-containing protein [Thermoplasmata archaeon]|nr:DUF2157 domain-containing protein [Thermoplasmata archaeon]